MRLANDGSSCYIAVDVSHRSVTDIDVEDANRVPAIDDLSHDGTEGSDLAKHPTYLTYGAEKMSHGARPLRVARMVMATTKAAISQLPMKPC